MNITFKNDLPCNFKALYIQYDMFQKNRLDRIKNIQRHHQIQACYKFL